MNTNSFSIDERLESIVAKHSDSQLLGLRRSLETRGCLDPIVVWDNNIIWDGVARYRICQELGIDFEVKYVEFKNLAEAASERIKHHKFRRQVNPTNRIDAALDLFEGELAEQAKSNLIDGARKGGLAKAENNDSEEKEDNRIWVNSIIAELSESNEAYVSCIRNLRKDAANNFDARTTLFELRRGDISVSSIMKSKKTKTVTPKTTTSKSKSKPTEKTLLEQYDANKWETDLAFKAMEYENIKDRIDGNEQQENVINPNSIFERVDKYCEEGKSYELVALLVPLMEISYRMGFIKGSMEQSEDGIRAEFINRESDLHRQLRQWLRNQDNEMFVTNNNGQQIEAAENN